MSLVTLDSQDSIPLVNQIVASVMKQVDDRAMRAGTRMPSIRKFAADHGVSRFTVVQAYDRLVATGYLRSRQGSGFYVAPRPKPQVARETTYKLDSATDILWLLRNALRPDSPEAMPGMGWLPHSWMDEEGIQRSLRTLSRKSGGFLTHYGEPAGYLPMRELLQHRLAEIGIHADPAQIILTKGASHAIDLVARYLVRSGDAVLVDDPGYFTLFGMLKSLNAKIVGVPWNQDGPDTEKLETLIREHKPRLFFTNSILHNPTGASISQPVAYRMLQLAEKYDLTIIEDDVYGDYMPAPATRLATLDQLNRVLYVGSFSKTISASARVGFIACRREIAENLTDLKLLSGLTTSELDERIIHQLLTDGYFRKHMDRLRSQLDRARDKTIRNLERVGFSLYVVPTGGMFIWAKKHERPNAAEIAGKAAKEGIILAPGNLFRPHQEPSPWLRFNVASCDDPALFRFLARQ
jgi:DNA-binding transcriptional MocR family regulator